MNSEKKYYATFSVPHRSAFRYYQHRVESDGRCKFVIQMTTPTGKANKLLQRMFHNILITLPIVLFLSIGFGLYASRQPFEIIRKMNRTARRITSKNMRQRLPVPSVESEVKDLTETINSMLDRLEKSFDEIKQFTADVSHELRTPLSAIKGEMEVVVSRERQVDEYKNVIFECLERVDGLIKLVNDFFLISRFDLNKITFDLKPVDLSRVVLNMFDFFLPIAHDKNLDFRIDQNDELVIKIDRLRIEQVLGNLIDNAIKFTPPGGTVKLSLVKYDAEVRFMVEDSVIGIPEQDLDNVFKRLFQVEDSRSDINSGSGLGLQICHRIVDVHHGSIFARRNKEKGVTFTVTLPLTG
jgi:heavy metal sensor kinase